ncbi:hypothetical protein M3J07_013812 [Ascochyta lentis]
MRPTLLLFTATAFALPHRSMRVVERAIDLQSSYDFIIAGGGTSGLTVAHRLTEDRNVSVLVIEAGPLDDGSNGITIPGLNNGTGDLPYWFPGVQSLPIPGLNNRTFSVPTPRVVGGASTINGMVYDRGEALDYDAWQKLGNPGWGWEDMYPYFKKAENYTPPNADLALQWNISFDESTHGAGGPIQASFPPWYFPAAVGFTQGISELGIPTARDPGSGYKSGIGWAPSAITPGSYTRSYARSGYYDENTATRANYDLLTSHTVVQVLIENRRAVGVQYVSRETNKTSIVRASKEVIMATGTFFTPKILQISGIGPRHLLEELGVEVLADLPVGYNFQDHLYTATKWNYSDPLRPVFTDRQTNNTLARANLEEYFTSHTGPYTVGAGNTLAFLPTEQLLLPARNITTNITASSILALAKSTTAEKVYPWAHTPSTVVAGWSAQRDILVGIYALSDASTVEFAYNTSPFMVAYLLRPLSRGFVAATKPDTVSSTSNATKVGSEPPAIQYGSLLADSDIPFLVASIRFMRELLKTDAAIAAFGADTFEEIPVLRSNGTETDDEIAALQRAQVFPADSHPVGTCSMLPKHLGGVVSPELKVYGVEGLRIVDASIIPLIPSAHPMSTVYAVAEKAADIIKRSYGINVHVL